MTQKNSVLDDHKLHYEDPHPKHVTVNPTKHNRFVGLFTRIGRGIKSFFRNIKLALKELVDTVM